MDNLDRMYRHLVRTIRARFPQYLTTPFNVADLHQTILPYRLHRRELGLDTNEDYEITLTELLSGSREYVAVDDAMREALRKQLSTPNPDSGIYKQYAAARVSLAPAALRSLEIGPDEDSLTGAPKAARVNAAPAQTAPAAATPHTAAPTPGVPTPRTTARPAGPLTTSPTGVRRVTPETGDRCRSCGESLPAGRAITYCPHCGQNLTTMHCLGCGSELEVGWKFCPTCGRPAATT